MFRLDKEQLRAGWNNGLRMNLGDSHEWMWCIDVYDAIKQL